MLDETREEKLYPKENNCVVVFSRRQGRSNIRGKLLSKPYLLGRIYFSYRF
ncbi:hypothetical protein DB41_HG00010 [Neochlamydia sp. TUME1]|nr:hypothetical protein DB41_HG00010 [Neochlamydia sp. TUME1]